LVEIFGQTESDLFFNTLMSNIVGPIIDLDKTAVSEINEVDFKFVKVVLDKDESVDFLATIDYKRCT
jgi:hypothetical protein